MNSRDRVVAALRGEQPDRIPFDLGSTLVTGITRGAYLDLAERLGHDTDHVALYDVAQQLSSSLPAHYVRIFWEQPCVRMAKEAVERGHVLYRDI